MIPTHLLQPLLWTSSQFWAYRAQAARQVLKRLHCCEQTLRIPKVHTVACQAAAGWLRVGRGLAAVLMELWVNVVHAAKAADMCMLPVHAIPAAVDTSIERAVATCCNGYKRFRSTMCKG